MSRSYLSLALSFLCVLCALCVESFAADPQHVVFVTGDDEYVSEQSMPMIADILSKHHGMKTTVLYATNEQGQRDTTAHNIPGLEALRDADLAVFFMRWRELPQEQLDEIVRYAESGKPMIGLRTASHALKTATITASSVRSVSHARTTVSSAATNRQTDQIAATITTSVVTTRNRLTHLAVTLKSLTELS